MTKQNEKLDAAEYVIGTLSGEEKEKFKSAIQKDRSLLKDMYFWERAFGALNASVAPEAPPQSVWERIEAELPQQSIGETGGTATASRSAANDNSLDKLQRSLSRWRMGAIAAGFAAIGLGAFVANTQFGIGNPANQPQLAEGLNGEEFIAVVNANGDQPSLVVNVNAKTGEVTVRSIGVEKPDDKSLELWYVPEGKDAVSVGLVGEGGIDLKNITAKGGDLLAISLEPKGGSPTGTATGPVIYTGKLIKNIDAE